MIKRKAVLLAFCAALGAGPATAFAGPLDTLSHFFHSIFSWFDGGSSHSGGVTGMPLTGGKPGGEKTSFGSCR